MSEPTHQLVIPASVRARWHLHEDLADELAHKLAGTDADRLAALGLYARYGEHEPGVPDARAWFLGLGRDVHRAALSWALEAAERIGPELDRLARDPSSEALHESVLLLRDDLESARLFLADAGLSEPLDRAAAIADERIRPAMDPDVVGILESYRVCAMLAREPPSRATAPASTSAAISHAAPHARAPSPRPPRSRSLRPMAWAGSGAAAAVAVMLLVGTPRDRDRGATRGAHDPLRVTVFRVDGERVDRVHSTERPSGRMTLVGAQQLAVRFEPPEDGIFLLELLDPTGSAKTWACGEVRRDVPVEPSRDGRWSAPRDPPQSRALDRVGAWALRVIRVDDCARAGALLQVEVAP